MTTMINLVWKLIGLSVSLAMAGNIVEMTAMMGKHATKAHKRGIISLKAWNHQLQGRTSNSRLTVKDSTTNARSQ